MFKILEHLPYPLFQLLTSYLLLCLILYDYWPGHADFVLIYLFEDKLKLYVVFFCSLSSLKL